METVEISEDISTSSIKQGSIESDSGVVSFDSTMPLDSPRGLLVPESNISKLRNNSTKDRIAANVTMRDRAEPESTPRTEGSKKSPTENFFRAFYLFLFPKIAPIPWSTFFALSFFAALPTVGYIIAFTKMGFGVTTFYFFAENLSQYIIPLASGLGGSVTILYLLDVQDWSSCVGDALRKVFITTVVIAAFALALFAAGDYPYGPIFVFVIMTALFMEGVQLIFYRKTASKTYLHWLSGPLFFVSFLTFLSWLIWTFLSDSNEWNTNIALADAKTSGCKANFADYPDCRSNEAKGGTCFRVNLFADNALTFEENCDESCIQVYDHCYNTFIIWVGPFLASIGLLFLSFFASFLRVDGTPEQEASKFASVWLFLLFAFWVAASLAGVGQGVSTTLAVLVLASFIAAAIFLAIAYNSKERKDRFDAVKKHLLEKYGSLLDVFRGLLVVTCTPVIIFYILVSFVKQRVRRISLLVCSKTPSTTQNLTDVTSNGWFTVEAQRLIRHFQSWDKTKVIVYAIYWGLAFMILNVIVFQYTLVFLSWLIQTTSDMSLGMVTLILVLVGLTMFLLPPVPGVPIYLTLGIVIIPVGQEIFGIYLSIIYAIGISLALKLFACTLQQKLIGEQLHNFVSVRQLVSVNSDFIRSMKLVLKEPGMGLAKVAILVGGPDWPTSVLCGIMKLPLLPILFGTLPIIFLIIPTLLTGSFMYMSDIRDANGQNIYPWAGTAATVFTALTAFVQFGSMVVAAYFLEKVVSERADELEAIPIDEEVKLADEKGEVRRKAYREISKWEKLPWLAKVTLILSLMSMITTCYLVQIFAADCFVEYQLTYNIDVHLNGDWRNLVKPLGVVANYLLLSSTVLYLLFNFWAQRNAVKALASGGTRDESSSLSLSDESELL